MTDITQSSTQQSLEVNSSLPTYQEIEKSIINILRAGDFYNKDKDKGFMDYYKKQFDELRKSEDRDQYIIDKAKALLPNKEIYDIKIKAFTNSYYKSEPRISQSISNYIKLMYKIAKEYFISDEQREEEFQAWLNS